MDNIIDYKSHNECVHQQNEARKEYYRQELERDKENLQCIINYARKAKLGDLHAAHDIARLLIDKQRIIDVKTLLT